MSKTSIEPTALLRRTLSGPTMGSRWSAVFHVGADFDTAPLASALAAVVTRVDRQMSSWAADSDLNRLNRAPVGVWVDIPREMVTVLTAALTIGEASGGAFDIGVGELVAAWGFGGGSRRPDLDRIAAASSRGPAPVLRALELDETGARVRKHVALSLDLGGIAKGFGVDELGRVMDEFGVGAWLVGIDGEIRGRGAKPDGTPWAVAHERPKPGEREAMGVFELTDVAIATSGTYRHFTQVDGRTVSHTMNPGTATPLDNALVSVSVLAESCMVADAWATALMVLGETDGPALARRLGMSAVFVLADGAVVSTM